MLPLGLLVATCLMSTLSAGDLFLDATEVAAYSFGPQSDLDFDEEPDDWVRRRGEGFPAFPKVRLDRNEGRSAPGSLRFDPSGANVAIYAPPVPISDAFAYQVRGYVRCRSLQRDVAMLSVSFLNAQRKRIQRRLSVPTQGPNSTWTMLDLPGLTPPPDAAFIVIGCHVTGNSPRDVSSSVWFDDLRIARLPRLEIRGDIRQHYVGSTEPLRVETIATGIDHPEQHAVLLRLQDDAGLVLLEERRSLQTAVVAAVEGEQGVIATAAGPQAICVWELPPQAPGYYRADVRLLRNGREVGGEQMAFAVIELSGDDAHGDEFGWSLSRPLESHAMSPFLRIAAQSGVGWIKYPLWERSTDAREAMLTNGVLLDGLKTSRIDAIGVLESPPAELRRHFPEKWAGVAELFGLPVEVWGPTLRPVIARYAASVMKWQIGGDDDTSFVGREGAGDAFEEIDREVSRVGRKVELGSPWTWDVTIPPGVRPHVDFLPLSLLPDETPAGLADRLRQFRRQGLPIWLTIDFADLEQHREVERSNRLCQLVLAAKQEEVARLFFGNAVDERHGLITPEGEPLPLWLPWRTLAVQLRGARYLGTMTFPNRSQNAIFERGEEAIIVAWRNKPAAETLYLGEDVRQLDLWGRAKNVPRDAVRGEQTVELGPNPTLLTGCSAAVAKWRLSHRWERGQIASEYGGHAEALVGMNTFRQGVSGTVTVQLPKNWLAAPATWDLQAAAGESFRLPTHLTLPPDANLGWDETEIAVDLTADRRYRFKVYRPYRVGLEDIQIEVRDRRLPDGRLEIEQIVTNRTQPNEILNFRCTLFVPNERRQRLVIARLGQGSDRKVYHVGQAEALRGSHLWVRLEQDGGKRVLNYRWLVGETWETPVSTTTK